MSNSLRSLRRGIIKNRMKKAGVRKVNKGFRWHWREEQWNIGFLKKKKVG